jgi:hypothetical protein
MAVGEASERQMMAHNLLFNVALKNCGEPAQTGVLPTAGKPVWLGLCP